MSGIVRANNAGQSGAVSNIETIDSDDYVDGSIDTAHIAVNQVTLAEMAGITRGSIIYGDASGDPAALAKGTEDYVLTAGADDVAWAAAAGGPSQANQAALEAETNQDTYAAPDMIKYSPGVAKAHVSVDSAASEEGSPYNVVSITDNATGDNDVVFGTDFSDALYVGVGVMDNGAQQTRSRTFQIDARAATDCQVLTFNSSSGHDSTALSDNQYFCVFFGDQ